MNPLVYAYIGDAVFEIYVRDFLIKKGLCKVNKLQKTSVKFVSAKAQAKFLNDLIEIHFFNEEEISFIKRSRNQKVNTSPKNVDILTYKHATAFEAIIGYFYYNNKARMEILINKVLEDNNGIVW